MISYEKRKIIEAFLRIMWDEEKKKKKHR
jgi:hypothetical protein